MNSKKDGPNKSYNGSTRWYRDGVMHREDGPAFISPAGQSWWLNGKLHREDGPAVIYNTGRKYWFLNDYKIPVQSQREFECYFKLIAFQ
jgi:hypothetical protein